MCEWGWESIPQGTIHVLDSAMHAQISVGAELGHAPA